MAQTLGKPGHPSKPGGRRPLQRCPAGRAVLGLDVTPAGGHRRAGLWHAWVVSTLVTSAWLVSGCDASPSVAARHASAAAPGPGVSGDPSAADEPILQGGTLTLLVSGLTCPSCVRQVDTQLRQLPGVREVQFDTAAGTVRVVYDAQRPPRASEVKEAVRWGGGVVVAIEQP